jgi:lipoprotein signal peptidase
MEKLNDRSDLLLVFIGGVMRKLIEHEKKMITVTCIITVLLVALDLVIKLFILNTVDGLGDYFHCAGGANLFHFHPSYNESGSMILQFLNIPYNRILFLAFVFLAILITLYLSLFLIHIKPALKMSNLLVYPVICLFAASAFGRFFERIIWEYTLNYIKTGGTSFDTIDIYIIGGVIGLLILIVHIILVEKNKSINVDNEIKIQYKQYNSELFHAFINLMQHFRH